MENTLPTHANHALYMPDQQEENNRTPNASERLNPFITTATPLLTMIIHIRHSELPNNIEELRQQIINEMGLYQNTLNAIHLEPRQIQASCYCLCTAIDEAVLNTPWGTSTIWSQHSLLSYFHNETWGGERFYTILEEFANFPRTHLDILELIYLILSLGYEGQFFNTDLVIREEIRSRVFQRIKALQGKVSRQLSPHAYDPKLLQKDRHSKSVLKKICILGTTLLLTSNFIFNHKLTTYTKSQIKTLDQIALESPITAYSQLLDRSITAKDLQH